MSRLWSALPGVFAIGGFGFAVVLYVFGMGQLAAATLAVGWALLAPLATVVNEAVFDDDGTAGRRDGAADSTTADSADPVEALRHQYATGEIDDAEFERRLEALIATEDADPETALDRLTGDRSASERSQTEQSASDDEATGAGADRESEFE